jgi:glucose-6-phosphate 1-epimerase
MTEAVRVEMIDGLAVAVVAWRRLRAKVLLQGAHLWRVVDDGVERLYRSPASVWRPGTPVRGGIPVCWPWLGRHNERADWPMHGPLRVWPFDLAHWSCRGESVLLRFTAELPASAPGVLSTCRAAVDLRLAPSTVVVALTVINHGDRPQPSAGALHTYLRCDALGGRVHGLDGRPCHDSGQTRCAAVVDGVLADLGGACTTVHDEGGPVRVEDGGGVDCCLFRRGSRSLVVWNPGADHGIDDLPAESWRSFVCVETANSDDDARTIAPGGWHRMVTRYRFK